MIDQPSTPLISVVIPTFNQAAFLPASISSAVNQSYTHLEILLINDGSTDETEALCRSFAKQDQRISYLVQPNRGPASARNLGIAAAQGLYICLLDGDDVMDPERIALQLSLFQQDPSFDIVYTALHLIDSQGQLIGEMHGHDYAPENFLAHLFFRNLIPGPSAIMAKRTCLAEHPYNEAFIHAEDYELMMRLAHLYRFKYLDIPLTSYRRHGQNLSNNLAAHRQAELSVLHQYSQSHIESVVDSTSLKEAEKKLLKGKILFNQEHTKQALAFFEQVQEPIALFYKGNCHFKLNNLETACKAYQEAIQLDDSNAACQNNLGAVYALKREWSQARACFEKALQLKPGYLDASHNLTHLDSPPSLRLTWRELRQDLIPYSNF